MPAHASKPIRLPAHGANPQVALLCPAGESLGWGVTCLLHSQQGAGLACNAQAHKLFLFGPAGSPCCHRRLPPWTGMPALHTTHDNASTCELPSSALQGSFVGVSVCHLRSYPGAFPDPRAASLYTVRGGGPPPPATCSCALQSPCTTP